MRRVSGIRAAVDALERLGGGLATGIAALAMLAVVAVSGLLCAVGVGLWLLPRALRGVRAVADRERARLSRSGREVHSPYPTAQNGRDLAWLATHATLGNVVGLFGVLTPLLAARDLLFPLYWRALPEGEAAASLGVLVVRTWPGAVSVSLLGVAWLAVAVFGSRSLADLQAWPGRRLLPARAGVDLSLRVTELTATRAAALEAHAAELRRIERSLHDGAQNRLVGVTVLLGAARRALARDPAVADEFLELAQQAAEDALAELRGVARGILPPVLTDRGLGGALAGLAAGCRVPCRVDVRVARRCPASVEATAYFVVAEALTNISRHSGATAAVVSVLRAGDVLSVTVRDDGRGGAEQARAGRGSGSGLDGIRRRVAAHDGTFALSSPPGGPTELEVVLPCGS
ncbi:sensor domain-containing protein [Dactylosporangium sp. NPDC051485]|uniref:sensor histidine kinase n=1 Tax=Dactylosporangium sp. NPDC051485 TaxID=3154846 RepID=UPI00343950B2